MFLSYSFTAEVQVVKCLLAEEQACFKAVVPNASALWPLKMKQCLLTTGACPEGGPGVKSDWTLVILKCDWLTAQWKVGTLNVHCATGNGVNKSAEVIRTCIHCFHCPSVPLRQVMEEGQQQESENQDPSCVLTQARTLNQYQAAKRGMSRIARIKVTYIKPVLCAKLNAGISEGLWVLTCVNGQE